ncbi:hypothetical protein [Paraburkholderia sabiae]
MSYRNLADAIVKGVVVMRTIVLRLIVVIACAGPALVLAQQSAAPSADQANDAQAAQAGTGNAASYGGSTNGAQQAGSTHHLFGSMFRHGSGASGKGQCVGPVSYCDIFFGS